MLISPYTAPQLATEKNAGADKSDTRRKSCTFGIELFGMERAIIAADKTEMKRMRHNSSILTHSSPAAFTITNRNVPPTPPETTTLMVNDDSIRLNITHQYVAKIAWEIPSNAHEISRTIIGRAPVAV